MRHHAAAMRLLHAGICLMLRSAFWRKTRNLNDEEIVDVLSSNLCRCTGYENIVKAVKAIAAEMKAQA